MLNAEWAVSSTALAQQRKCDSIGVLAYFTGYSLDFIIVIHPTPPGLSAPDARSPHLTAPAGCWLPTPRRTSVSDTDTTNRLTAAPGQNLDAHQRADLRKWALNQALVHFSDRTLGDLLDAGETIFDWLVKP